ncbi:MAG: 30S ribosomal protein S6 [Pirellulaceae bacterium]
MASNVYESLFILDSNRYARDPGGLSTSLTDIIEGLGGTVLASRLWMEQKLAYPIDGHQKGTYWLVYHRTEGPALTGFDRACRLNEGIVRQMTLKIDPRLVEPMVAHARGETQQGAEEGEGEGEEAAEHAETNANEPVASET